MGNSLKDKIEIENLFRDYNNDSVRKVKCSHDGEYYEILDKRVIEDESKYEIQYVLKNDSIEANGFRCFDGFFIYIIRIDKNENKKYSWEDVKYGNDSRISYSGYSGEKSNFGTYDDLQKFGFRHLSKCSEYDC